MTGLLDGVDADRVANAAVGLRDELKGLTDREAVLTALLVAARAAARAGLDRNGFALLARQAFDVGG